MNFIYNAYALLFGRNLKSTPKEVILDQMNEPRSLPLGKTEFEVWSDRIISGALIPGATDRDLKFTLANCILHLGPTESFKPDVYFIHSLRKIAQNQVALTIIAQLKAEQQAEAASKPAESKDEPKTV